MTDATIQELFETLYEGNKYLITIKDSGKHSWEAFLYKNKHIQLDLQTPDALISQHIDIPKLLEYIDNTENVKIKYTCVYDDFKSYNKLMSFILGEIQKNYLQINKTIVVTYKTYYA
jgi:hypothetical protein